MTPTRRQSSSRLPASTFDDLVSDHFPLERSAEAFEHAVSRTGDKTVIVVSRS